MNEGSYGLGLSNAWSDEQRRLAAAELMFDPGTFRHLDKVGITAGMRCLEVGGGNGSVARWMAERVGPSGSVVVTDINVSGLVGCDAPNIEVRVHDVCADPLDEDHFDIVHTRLLLENVAPRLAVLAKLVTALRRGGWLVIEDFDCSAWLYLPEERLFCEPTEIRAIHQTALRAADERGGNSIDLTFGRDLPLHLVGAGLDSVGSEACSPLIVGGSPESEYHTLSARQVGPVLLDSGVPQAEVDRLIGAFEKPGAMIMFSPLVSAWGRRAD